MAEKKQAPYIELKPGTPEHRKAIADAILSNNFNHLASLHNRVHLPIHIVTGSWFWYSSIMRGSRKDVVVLYSPETQEKYETFIAKIEANSLLSD